MRVQGQISESLVLGILLALSGGYMDAYTYLCRGRVFANAQTGNILLFGIRLSEMEWGEALHYFVPVFAFALGVFTAQRIRWRYEKRATVHWRQISVLAEAIILAVVGFIPLYRNDLANSLVSFACGIQVQSFQRINGYSLATTMCIGNLRLATEALCDYSRLKDEASKRKGQVYFGFIGIFTIGAVLGNIGVSVWHAQAIWVSAFLMSISFFVMFIQERRPE